MLHVIFVYVVLEERPKSPHVFDDVCTDFGMFGRSAIQLIRERCKETIACIVSTKLVPHLGTSLGGQIHTIACYLLLVHTHPGKARPDSFWLANHAGKLLGRCMVSHDRE